MKLHFTCSKKNKGLPKHVGRFWTRCRLPHSSPVVSPAAAWTYCVWPPLKTSSTKPSGLAGGAVRPNHWPTSRPRCDGASRLRLDRESARSTSRLRLEGETTRSTSMLRQTMLMPRSRGRGGGSRACRPSLMSSAIGGGGGDGEPWLIAPPSVARRRCCWRRPQRPGPAHRPRNGATSLGP
jgi:hypothetical protein